MPALGKAFSITGVANTTTFATDYLESTEAEKKHCDSIILNLSGQVGNTIQVWLDREKLFEVYDYSLDTAEASGTNAYKSVQKLLQILVDQDIPLGALLKVAISCGGTAKNVYGTFVYHLI
jgi:hypothetical protein